MQLGAKLSAFLIGCGALHFTIFPWVIAAEKQNLDFKVYIFITCFTSVFSIMSYYLWSIVFYPFNVKIENNKLIVKCLFHHILKPKVLDKIQKIEVKEILHDSPRFKGQVKTVIITDAKNKSHHIASERTYKNMDSLFEFLNTNYKP